MMQECGTWGQNVVHGARIVVQLLHDVVDDARIRCMMPECGISCQKVVHNARMRYMMPE